MNTSRGLPRVPSRGFISLGLGLAIAIVIAAVLGGAGWYMKSQSPEVVATEYREINAAFGVDSKHAYIFGGIGKGEPVVIEGADAKTFVSTGEETAKDANHTYGLSTKGYLTIDGKATGPIWSEEEEEDNTTIASSCAGRDAMEPFITAITPASGPAGTKVEIKGCNLSGFEADLEATFERGDGAFIPLYAGTKYRTTPEKAEAMSMVVTMETYCPTGSIIGRYSGMEQACTPVEAKPGPYAVYVQTPEGKSNSVTFTVTAGSAGSTSGDVFSVVSPNGSESVKTGQPITIRWNTEGKDLGGNGNNVVTLSVMPKDLKYKDERPLGGIANVEASKLSYSWIPPTALADDSYKITATLTNGMCVQIGPLPYRGATCMAVPTTLATDESDDWFTIK